MLAAVDASEGRGGMWTPKVPPPPCQVGHLSSLRELLLPGNQLRALPPLARLCRLTALDLSSNLLVRLRVRVRVSDRVRVS